VFNDRGTEIMQRFPGLPAYVADEAAA